MATALFATLALAIRHVEQLRYGSTCFDRNGFGHIAPVKSRKPALVIVRVEQLRCGTTCFDRNDFRHSAPAKMRKEGSENPSFGRKKRDGGNRAPTRAPAEGTRGHRDPTGVASVGNLF